MVRVCAEQALGGKDWRWLAGRVVAHLGSADKAVADTAREVTRVIKKTNPNALPAVRRGHGDGDTDKVLLLVKSKTGSQAA